jgi:signal peptidase II
VPSDGAETARRHLGGTALLSVGIVVGVVALDQGTKAWAVSELPHAPISIAGDDVELRLSRNTGGAFSLFQGYTPLLAALAVLIALLLVRAIRRADDRVTLVALSLVLAGAMGNMADRLFRSPGFGRGAVVDFVRLGWWPTFNVADASITAGGLLLVVWMLFGPESPRTDATDPRAADRGDERAGGS